jgi:F0F1-type ATP synthase delta subunit
VDSLHTLKTFDLKKDEQTRSLLSSAKNLFENHSTLQKNLEEATLLAQSLIKDCDLAKHLKGILLKSEEKIAKPYKKLIKSLRLELEQLKSTNSDLNDKNSVLELRVFNFLQEVEKHRRNTRLSLLFTDPTEKICGNCQKVFKMMENFNWSCKHHKAKLVENIWFCCGKIGAKAEGCLVAKHVSVEEMEETRVDRIASVFCSVIFR